MTEFVQGVIRCVGEVVLAVGTFVLMYGAMKYGGWHASESVSTGTAVVTALMIWQPGRVT